MNNANQTKMETEITDNFIREIMAMETDAFHNALSWTEDELRKSLSEPSAVNIVAYDEEGRIAGYLMAMNFSKEIEELRNDADPEIEDIEDALYLNNIVIRKDLQGKGYFGKLIKTFLEKFPNKTIALHASAANNCSAGMQKYGATFIRRIENWYDSGEPFDYLIFNPSAK